VRKMNSNVKEFCPKLSYIIRLWLCDTGDGEGINERQERAVENFGLASLMARYFGDLVLLEEHIKTHLRK